jgi:DME family drug/metabolite transporter
MNAEAAPQLLALFCSMSYAGALVSSRLGLRYSTPTTVTLVSILVQNSALWAAVYWTGGIPQVAPIAVGLICIVGIFQLGVRLLAYTGVLKIGASRSSTLQSISPLVSATIAIAVLGETTTPLIVGGTLLVIAGVVMVSWKAEREIAGFRWRHLLLPIGAACLTGLNHPMRRYALGLSNEPLFFAAFMGTISLLGFLLYMGFAPAKEPLIWNRQAVWPFLSTGIFETSSLVLIITAISIGPVVVVAPIAASYPVWALIGAKWFLHDLEKITWKTVVGILSVVAGTAAIHFGR